MEIDPKKRAAMQAHNRQRAIAEPAAVQAWWIMDWKKKDFGIMVRTFQGTEEESGKDWIYPR
jgi:hypothetical protein